MKLGLLLQKLKYTNNMSLQLIKQVMNHPAKAKASCWKGYKAEGKKKSPSGKKTKGGKVKMVNNCVKK